MRDQGPVDNDRGPDAITLFSFRNLRAVYSHDSHPRHWLVLAIIATVVCAATVALVLLGFIAIREWRRATEQLGQQRTAEALALVSSAIDHDMKGAWATLIAPVNPLTLDDTPPYDLLQPVAKTFARYPYPESLVVWKASDNPTGATYVFNRADRPPPWRLDTTPSGPFPIVLLPNPSELEPVVSELSHLTSGDAFACRNVSIGGESYQIVAHLFYGEPDHRRVTQYFGLLINMKWIRQFYFDPIITQVAKIGGSLDTLSFRVFDEHDQLIAHSKDPRSGASTLSRSFPLMFCDRTLLPFLPEAPPTFPEWSIRVSLADTDAFLAVTDSAWSMWVLLVVSASASMISLFLIMRAIRASEALTTMKSEFVATVTHELKTPLALFHLVGDTLSRNRYNSPETIREYAKLLSKEATHLGQLIDHLLMYAKYSTMAEGEHPSTVVTSAHDLVEGALERLRPSLEALGFELSLDVPATLPPVVGDRGAMMHVMECVIDNAIKYSDDTRVLKISAARSGAAVKVTIADSGVGIRPEELPHVFDRFYRGTNTRVGGSGLGLAIARRVVNAHGGSVNIRSEVGSGTVVEMTLVAEMSA